MKIEVALLMLGAAMLCSMFLVSCAVSPQKPTARYKALPQGPDEEAVSQAFEALVQAYGSRDWDGMMVLIADDAHLESAAPDAAGGYGVFSPRVITKREFGQAIKPIVASAQGYHVGNVKLVTVNPTQVQVSGTMTLLTAGRAPLSRDRLWVFEKRGERWLVVRAQYLWVLGQHPRHYRMVGSDPGGGVMPVLLTAGERMNCLSPRSTIRPGQKSHRA